MTPIVPIIRTPDIADERFKLRGPRRAATPATGSPASHDDQQNVDDNAARMFPKYPSEREEDGNKVYQQAQGAGYQAGYASGAEAGYQEGFESGSSAGHEAGLVTGETEGRDAYSAGLRQLEELTQSLNLTVERSLEEAEDMMVSIVFESVCKMIGDALATREGVTAVIKETLGRIRGKSALIIRVNPLDLELIEESAAFGVASEADWRADDAIPMGGCVVESEYGTLDARMDTQFNQLKRVLLAARHRPSDGAKAD